MGKIKKVFPGVFFVLLGLVGYLAVPTPSLASHSPLPHGSGPNLDNVLPSTPSNVPREFSSIKTAIETIFNVIIVIAGTIFVVLFLIGGIMYLTGAGNEEQTGKAKKLMIDAIIGLILTLAAWAIGIFLLGKLGFTGSAIPVGIIGGGGGPVGGTVRQPPWNISFNSQSELDQLQSDCSQVRGRFTQNILDPVNIRGEGSCN